MKRLLGLCFVFNDTATTEIYTLSLHDALPISAGLAAVQAWTADRSLLRQDPATPSAAPLLLAPPVGDGRHGGLRDRKSTRLNSSHANISYAAFCLKKKNSVDLKTT